MPIKIRKLPGKNKFRVYEGSHISAKGTSWTKALKQRNLLQGLKHGWKPSKRRPK